jgi:acyl dehydratase
VTDDDLKSIIGQPTSNATVVIERGPVSFFADAVVDANPIYHNPQAAEAAGLAGIPAPPTYSFAMEHWGKYEELQPADAPTGNPMLKAFGPLMAKGGIILHGEQEFIYHRPIVVGDRLVGQGKVVDVYQKESKGKTMTFLVTETNWTDERTGEPVVTSRFNVIHRI